MRVVDGPDGAPGGTARRSALRRSRSSSAALATPTSCSSPIHSGIRGRSTGAPPATSGRGAFAIRWRTMRWARAWPEQRRGVAGAGVEVDHDDLVRLAGHRAWLGRSRVVDEGGLQPAQVTGERLGDRADGGVGHDGEVHLAERDGGVEQFQFGGERQPARRGRA